MKIVKKILKFICKCIFVYSFCGGLYLLIEIAFRQRTDLSMFFLAGFIGLFVMFFNNVFTYETDYLIQIMVCTTYSTLMEGFVGNIINYDYHIWDYRNLPFSFWNSQINLMFIGCWMFIVAVIIPILDYIDWKLFDYLIDIPPYYKVFGKKIYKFKKK